MILNTVIKWLRYGYESLVLAGVAYALVKHLKINAEDYLAVA